MQKQQKEFSQMELIELGQKAPYVSEIQCPTYLEYENCLDLYKLEVFKTFYKNSTEHKLFYQEIFGFANLSIREIYPGNKSMVFYYVSKGNWTSAKSIKIPISVYDPETRQRSFAILEAYKLGYEI